MCITIILIRGMKTLPAALKPAQLFTTKLVFQTCTSNFICIWNLHVSNFTGKCPELLVTRFLHPVNHTVLSGWPTNTFSLLWTQVVMSIQHKSVTLFVHGLQAQSNSQNSVYSCKHKLSLPLQKKKKILWTPVCKSIKGPRKAWGQDDRQRYACS